jgi:formylglycine-generating enzyme required for sulfatase activity
VVVNDNEPETVTAPTLELTKLVSGTPYTWMVRAGKGDTWSEWANGPGFSTGVVAPVYSEVIDRSVCSALLLWDHPEKDNREEMVYEVLYDDNDEAIHLTGPACQLADLAPGTSHTWKVRAGKNEVWSEWVDGAAFETLPLSVLPDIEGDMVLVEGGTFSMGSTAAWAKPQEAPVHQVTLSDFYINKYEVTQAFWRLIWGYNTAAQFPGNEGEDRPVVGVLHWQAAEFVRRLNFVTGENYALPTEAQWEYAARGGNQSEGYRYAGSDNIDEVAWHEGNSAYDAHKPVGGKAPNELGLYDMTGNAQEWCSDWYNDYSSEAQTDPTGPETFHPSFPNAHVGRGGGWSSTAEYSHVTFRQGMEPTQPNAALGLRLVRNP